MEISISTRAIKEQQVTKNLKKQRRVSSQNNKCHIKYFELQIEIIAQDSENTRNRKSNRYSYISEARTARNSDRRQRIEAGKQMMNDSPQRSSKAFLNLIKDHQSSYSDVISIHSLCLFTSYLLTLQIYVCRIR